MFRWLLSALIALTILWALVWYGPLPANEWVLYPLSALTCLYILAIWTKGLRAVPGACAAFIIFALAGITSMLFPVQAAIRHIVWVFAGISLITAFLSAGWIWLDGNLQALRHLHH